MVVHAALRFIDNVLRCGADGVHLVESSNGIECLENLEYGVSSRPSDWQSFGQWAHDLVDEFYGESYVNEAEEEREGALNLLRPQPSSFGAGVGAGRGANMTKPAWMTSPLSS